MKNILLVLIVVLLPFVSITASEPDTSGKENEPQENRVAYDWVIFDYGGTLTTELTGIPRDSPELKDLYGRIMGDWFEKKGYSVDLTDAQLQKLTEQAHKNTDGKRGQVSIADNIDYYTKWMAWIYKEAGIPGYITRNELEAARLYMLEEVGKLKTGKANAELISLLNTLKDHNIKMAVISNNSGYVEDSLILAGIRPYFEFVIDSARVGTSKPDREIFDIAVEENDLQGKKLLYVGNSYRCDVAGTAAAGWDMAWIVDEEEEKEHDPVDKTRVHVIRKLGELKPICCQ